MTKSKSGKQFDGTGMKIETVILEKVKKIFKLKYPHRPLHYDVEFVRAILVLFIEENESYLHKFKTTIPPDMR